MRRRRWRRARRRTPGWGCVPDWPHSQDGGTKPRRKARYIGRMAGPVIREHVPLADRTTLGLGGAARWLAECASDVDVREALEFAKRKDVPVWILGAGSNTIVPDEGFPGLVVHLA